MWAIALEAWSSRPLLGYGYYAGHRYGPYADNLSSLGRHHSAESAFIDGAFIETLVDTGVVGLITLVLMVWFGVRNLVVVGLQERALGAVALPVVLVLLVDAVMSYSLQTPSYQGIFFLALLLGGGVHMRDDMARFHGMEDPRLSV